MCQNKSHPFLAPVCPPAHSPPPPPCKNTPVLLPPSPTPHTSYPKLVQIYQFWVVCGLDLASKSWQMLMCWLSQLQRKHKHGTYGKLLVWHKGLLCLVSLFCHAIIAFPNCIGYSLCRMHHIIWYHNMWSLIGWDDPYTYCRIEKEPESRKNAPKTIASKE